MTQATRRAIVLQTSLMGALTILTTTSLAQDAWIVRGQTGWESAILDSEGLVAEHGSISPTGKTGVLKTKVQSFDTKRKATGLTLEQSAIWQNWNPVENIGPKNLQDAPVLLTVEEGNYWIFGRYGRAPKAKVASGDEAAIPDFQAEPAKLEGFDVPLQTTPFSHQFDAPGGLQPKLGGYHGWQSRDMKNWVHHGPVTETFSRWVTSAEMVDGKALIYYDFPNDQDPHVYVDADLTDGLPGENMGLAVADPSHGSDAGFIRDLDGRMHVIVEDWTPINARKRSWDSPLAGHAVSSNGMAPFIFQDPAVDQRTKPTGETATYKHPHWVKEDPKRFTTNVAEYEVHEPEQPAFGDWAPFCVGGQYYLFGDYDPIGGHQMSVGWFTSPSMDQQFTWCDHIGAGHPDPDIAFAEGQFYLATQQATDYVSPGPWVERVTVRVGVDTTGDGASDHWSDWSEVKERYNHTPGFSKQIAKTPASLDLTALPEGFGFQLELKIEDTTENKSKPMVEALTLSFG